MRGEVSKIPKFSQKWTCPLTTEQGREGRQHVRTPPDVGIPQTTDRRAPDLLGVLAGGRTQLLTWTGRGRTRMVGLFSGGTSPEWEH